MRIPNIYTNSPLADNSLVELDQNASQHLGKVLRMQVGDTLRLFNGNGRFYLATLTHITKKSVSATTLESEPANTESPLYSHLAQVISRGDRMDYAIQKATELGVNEVTPLFSERCEVKLNPERQAKRVAHWQQVAISAAEQCLRASVPKLNPIVSLNEFLANAKDNGYLKLVLHHRDCQQLESLSPPERVLILIGPEGGLSESEIAAAGDKAFISTTLGPRVFRTETAPIATLSVLQWLWGDMKG